MIRDIGSRWELMVDQWLIERMDGARLELHSPVQRDVALHFDAPWEGPISYYVTVLHDGEQYRLYYRGVCTMGKGNDEYCVTSVALSDDGIHWERPNLGLFEWEGSTDNSIVCRGELAHCFAPFVDSNPAADPAQRFKAVSREKIDGKAQLMAYVSPDGYRWEKLRDEPIITDGYFDSQNLVYWDATRAAYVAFYRDFVPAETAEGLGIRSIKYAKSTDWTNWPAGEWLDFGDAPLEHFYTNATVSYFRAPHLYLAFPKRFVYDRKSDLPHAHQGVSDAVFMSSRDGVQWDRTFLEAFIRPGRDPLNWTDRNMGVAWGIVPTAADELSIYWVDHYRDPSVRLQRGTLRMDGFASLHAGYAEGEVVTHPVRFSGNELAMNYATSAAGTIRVELQRETGEPIPGYTLADAVATYGDEIEGVIRWQGGSDVSALAGQPVRLRILFNDADVYALGFRERAAA